LLLKPFGPVQEKVSPPLPPVITTPMLPFVAPSQVML